MSRTSTRQYRHSDKPVPEIARELNVDGIVEGSALRTGDSLELRFRLIQAGAKEREVWSGTYERNLRDAVNLQLDVARAIAQAARQQLTPENEEHLSRRRKVDPELYDDYLRGMFYVNEFTDEGFTRGLKLLNEANARDPADPLPYVGLAQAYSILGHGPRPDVLPRAKEAARRALELDPESAEAYAVLGEAYLYSDWDLPRAEQALRQSLALNPDLADTQAHWAWYLTLRGKRTEAVAAMERAVSLDPLSPLLTSWLAWIRLMYGDVAGAITDSRHSAELSPDFAPGLFVLGNALLAQGDTQQAIAVHLKVAAQAPAWRWGLGYVYARIGRDAEARQIAADLARKVTPFGAWGLAVIHAGLRDNDESLRWVDSAIARRFSWVPWLGLDTVFTPLRSDPRFRQRLRALDLPGE